MNHVHPLLNNLKGKHKGNDDVLNNCLNRAQRMQV